MTQLQLVQNKLIKPKENHMKTISSLKRFGKLSILVGGLIFAAQNSNAFCFWNCSAKGQSAPNAETLMSLNTIQSTLSVLNADEVLKNLNEQMTTSFSTIDGYLAARENAKAQKLAVELIHQVQIKSGFEFKTTLQKSFFTKTILPKYSLFPDLPKDQQQVIIKEISGYRQGLFIDMINLTKRIAIYKAKAELAMFLESGSLRESARSRILTDLALAAVSPIQIKDKNSTTLQIPSKYVIDANYTFMFDYEIELFIVKNPEARITINEFESEKNTIIRNGTEIPTLQVANLCNQFEIGRRGLGGKLQVSTEALKNACRSDLVSRPEVIMALLNYFDDFDNCVFHKANYFFEIEYESNRIPSHLDEDDIKKPKYHGKYDGAYGGYEELPLEKVEPIIYESILNCVDKVPYPKNNNRK